ncbi:hypothetical protein MNBD_GAMMA02-743 [hydrothermal vent metagenome]|uniref:Uncharacterized protein n=1 Tax=hydrothermal vent metagenome TaxID=652676 RepID=A0A3B0VSC7_9ZZZZ
MLLIVVFLWLPKPWTLALFQPNSVIEIELIETQPTIPDPPISEPKPIKQPLVEPVFEQPDVPIETAVKNEEVVVEPTPKEVARIKPASEPQESVISKPTTTPEINAGKVLQMMQNRTSIDITPEFQARTGPATDFYIPKQQIHDWLADIPYLDESVDKPKLQMKFYAEGLDGSIEKFFDKITTSKTFTTKYGTKIHCALIGIIAMCGWK